MQYKQYKVILFVCDNYIVCILYEILQVYKIKQQYITCFITFPVFHVAVSMYMYAMFYYNIILPVCILYEIFAHSITIHIIYTHINIQYKSHCFITFHAVHDMYFKCCWQNEHVMHVFNSYSN